MISGRMFWYVTKKMVLLGMFSLIIADIYQIEFWMY